MQKLKNIKQINWISLMPLFIGIFVLLLFMISMFGDMDLRVSQLANDYKLSEVSNDSSVWLNAKNPTFSLQAFMWKKTLTFTYMTNFFLGLSLIFFGLYRKKHIWAQRFFFLSVTWITITFLIYWTLIFGFSSGSSALAIFYSTITHAINPAIGFVVFVIYHKEIKMKKLDVFYSVIFMFAYYFFALTLFLIGLKGLNTFNDVENKYALYDLPIYSFLNFAKPLFYSGDSTALKVLFNILIVVGGLGLVIAFGFMWYGISKIKCKNTKKEK